MSTPADSGCKVRLDAATRILSITWSDGATNAYHYIWLRHSARCADGMPNDTRVKIDLVPDDPETLVVDRCHLTQGRLEIVWGDRELTTSHDLEALRRMAYDAEARATRKHLPCRWDRDNAGEIPVFDHADLETDETRLQLMLALCDYGLARVTGVPAEAGSLLSVAELFGPIHVNNYGRVFDVRSDANLNLGSNTGHFLPPHTDESYRHDAPGISFFHCLEAAPEGGASILVDGFHAAQILREQHPDSFELLTRVPVFFQRYALPDEDMRSHTRMLVTDIDGDVVGVRWTDRTLPPQDLPAHYVEPVYRAIRRLWTIINDDALQFRYVMRPGDLHLFDNHRVLHGRLAFDPASGSRHLQQCSVNRDEFHNRLRILAARANNPAADWVLAGGAVG